MKRFRAVLGQTEFQVLLFFVCVVLFAWPLISSSDLTTLKQRFIFIFSSWGVVILVLHFVSRSLTTAAQSDENNKGE